MVIKNSGRIVSGDVGLFKYVRDHAKAATAPDPPTMMTGGKQIALYPATEVATMTATAETMFAIWSQLGICRSISTPVLGTHSENLPRTRGFFQHSQKNSQLRLRGIWRNRSVADGPLALGHA